MKKLTKRKKQQIRRWCVLIMACGVIAAFVISLFAAIGHFVYQRYFQTEGELDYSLIAVKMPSVQEEFLTPNVNSRPGTSLETVNGIVVHYTANPGTDAIANRNYFESRKEEADTRENKVSSHFIIGLDGTIVQCIPLDEISYASNDRNQDTISIECCHPRKDGKFTSDTYRSLLKLTAWLCDTYELDTENIIRHYDVSGKLCPLYYVKHPGKWEKFLADVRQTLLEGMGSTE